MSGAPRNVTKTCINEKFKIMFFTQNNDLKFKIFNFVLGSTGHAQSIGSGSTNPARFVVILFRMLRCAQWVEIMLDIVTAT